MEEVNPNMEKGREKSLSEDEVRLRARIAAAITSGGGVKNLERQTGIPKGTLEKYAAQTSTASFVNAARIASAAGVTLDQIAFSQEEISKNGAADRIRGALARIESRSVGDHGNRQFDQPGMIAIPRYDEVRPSAGPGAMAIDETPTTRVAFEQRWLVDIGVRPDTAVILPAQGDSMEPTIRNGSPMVVDTSKTEVQNGCIYVIAVGDDLLVKRVRRRLDGLIDLISDNTAYPPETLAPDRLIHLRVIGRVYAAVSKF